MHPIQTLRPAILLASMITGFGCGNTSSANAPGTPGVDAAGDAENQEASATEASTLDGARPKADAASADGAGGTSSHDAGNEAGTTSDAMAPSLLHGVTVDDITNLSQVVASLGALPSRPTTRIVFDSGQSPSYYAQAVPAIHAVSAVMGEILDSSSMSGISVPQYAQRTSDYLAAFPTGVDIWEVGNEINGNWLGNESDVASKMTSAFDLVKAAGGRTELTLYGCSDSGATYDMFTWTQANVPARMLAGLDYVLVSYYEGDCGMPRSDWPSAFQELRQLFPSAGLGFGEVGYVDKNGNDLALSDEMGAATYLQKYYGMSLAVPGYVGGYFWWYFAEDMVPASQPLFGVLSGAFH
jgi:hypothetical protein